MKPRQPADALGAKSRSARASDWEALTDKEIFKGKSSAWLAREARRF